MQKLKLFKVLMVKNYFVVLLFFLLQASCISDNKKVIVDFNGPAMDSAMISFHHDEAIHVAIAAMTSPKESFVYYNDMLQYISTQIGIPVHYIQKESYKEINDLLRTGLIDFAFIGSGAYIEAKEQKMVRLLAAPVISGSKSSKAYIITNKNSSAKSFDDLKAHSFAFSDPFSNIGYYYPIARLKKMGYNENNFFSKSIFTYGHDLSCQMVNQGIIDAASVHAFIFEYLKKYNPRSVENIKVIESSESFCSPPVVVPKQLDQKRYMLYKKIFLNMQNDPVGKKILERINIDYFAEVADFDYNSVRSVIEKSEK